MCVYCVLSLNRALCIWRHLASSAVHVGLVGVDCEQRPGRRLRRLREEQQLEEGRRERGQAHGSCPGLRLPKNDVDLALVSLMRGWAARTLTLLV